jgi:ketosteroid isomerase-like protein
MSTTTEDEQRAATLQIVGAYQLLAAQKRWDEWIELWAEDGVLEFPYAPAGRRRAYAGKADILAYMTATTGKIAVDSVKQMRVFPMQDPQAAAVEVSIKGHVPTSGVPYDQSYVLFFEARDGKLHRYREYWNPMISIDAVGDRETWTNAFGSPET